MELSGVYKMFNDQFFYHCQDVWIISDPHFGDEELEAGIPGRPSADELVKAINQKCGKTSALICLGDVGDLSYVRKLRAQTKILVCGNHDKGVENYKRKTVSRVFDTHIFSKEQAMATAKAEYPDYDIVDVDEGHQFRSPFIYWRIEMDNRLFDYVFEGPLMLGEKIILSHESIPSITWAKNLHGHNHGGPIESDKYHYNVCLDVQNYQPVHLASYLKGGLADIQPLHRTIINKAIERRRKYGKFKS